MSWTLTLLVSLLCWKWSKGLSSADLTFLSLSREPENKSIISSTCDRVRVGNFKARLDLFYLYSIEFLRNTAVNLDDVEQLLATAVAHALDDCDDLQQPLFAVQLSRNHWFLTGGECNSMSAYNECRTVRGITSILLESGAPEVEVKAYSTIESLLRNENVLRELIGPNVAQTSFEYSTGENLVLLDNNTDNSSAMNSSSVIVVAVAVVMMAFCITGVSFYGIWRWKVANMNDACAVSLKNRIAHHQAKRRHYFSELQDNAQLAYGWMATDPHQLNGQSITWSASDLTSDSHTIKSSLRLDRIDEEVDSEEGDTSSVGSQPDSSKKAETEKGEHLNFVAHWTDVSINPVASAKCNIEIRSRLEAEGIRFLADGSKDRYGKGVDANIETAQFELLATPSHQTAAGVKYPGDI